MTKQEKIRVIVTLFAIAVLLIVVALNRDFIRRKADEILSGGPVINTAAVNFSENGNGQNLSSSALSIDNVATFSLQAGFQARSGQTENNFGGLLTVNDLSNNKIGEAEFTLDETGLARPDWTKISGVNIDQNYIMIFSFPGYLSKRFNNVKANSGAELNTGVIRGGNVNGDNVVDIRDFAGLMSSWRSDDVNADFNGDSIVNIRDFAIMCASWDETAN